MISYMFKARDYPIIYLNKIITYKVNAAMRSEFVKLTAALYLVKAPDFVSKDTSVPSARALLPTTLAKLITGLAVKATLALIPA